MKELLFTDKLKVLFYHSIELTLVSAILNISSCNQSITDSPFILLSLFLSYKVSFDTKSLTKQDDTKFKNVILVCGMAYAGVVLIVKVTLMLSASFDMTSVETTRNLRSYGFYLVKEGESINFDWGKSVVVELAIIFTLSLYMYFHLKISENALEVRIEKQTTIHPVLVLEHEEQNKVSKLLDSHMKKTYQMSSTFTDSISNPVIGHPYFGEAHKNLYTCLLLLCVTQFSCFQTIFQFVSYLFFQFLILSQFKSSGKSEMNFIAGKAVKNDKNLKEMVRNSVFVQVLAIF